MARGIVVNVRSNKDANFTEAIAAGGEERENIVAPQALAAGLDMRSRLRTIRIISLDNLAWEVWLWSKDSFSDPDYNKNSFLGFWSFGAGDARQVGGSGVYYYYIDGLDVDYRDESFQGKIHCAIINRSVSAKTVGPNLVLELGLEPTT